MKYVFYFKKDQLFFMIQCFILKFNGVVVDIGN